MQLNWPLLRLNHTAVPTAHWLRRLSSPQGMYVFMHAVKGTPFETPDQGKARLLTHWEQLDYGVQFTSSRKFFTISPIILYVTHTHITHTETRHCTFKGTLCANQRS